MTFSDAEQAIINEMVAARTTNWPKPPWLQSHRMLRMKKEAKRQLAELPAITRRGPRSDRRTYWAPRRVRAYGTTNRLVIHESDGNLPICMLAKHYEAHPEYPLEHMGPGDVDCGQCFRINN
jgi:hypothetical protein